VDKLAIPHDALIFVGDGRKALFLRNAGDEKFPNLKTERVFAEENPDELHCSCVRDGLMRAASGQQRRNAKDRDEYHEVAGAVGPVGEAKNALMRCPLADAGGAIFFWLTDPGRRWGS
jgi:Bacterial archaeo-eukaryotic release factor family 12